MEPPCDPFARHPWSSMRGVGLLGLFRNKLGKVPVASMNVCPGHVALTLHHNGFCFTILFDLLAEQYSTFRPSHKDLVHFYSTSELIPYMLVIRHNLDGVPYQSFMGPTLANSSNARRFMSLNIDGSTQIWEFNKYSWQILQCFNMLEPHGLEHGMRLESEKRIICLSGSMLYWDSWEETRQVVRARPIGFECEETSSIVVGVETAILKAHKVLSILSTGIGLTVFLIKRSPNSPLMVCSSDRRGSVAMGELSTVWISDGTDRSQPLEAKTIDSNMPVKLFLKMRNSDLLILEWSTSAPSRLFVFAGNKSKLLCHLSQDGSQDTSQDLACIHDFQPTTHFALVLTSLDNGLLQAYDIQSGVLIFKAKLLQAPKYHFSTNFNPQAALVVCSGIAIQLVSLTQRTKTDMESEMMEASFEAKKGRIPTMKLPALIAPALVSLYSEQSPLPPPPSLLAMHLKTGASREPTKPSLDNSAPTNTASACRAALLNHQRPKGHSRDVLSERLLESVLDFLHQTSSPSPSNSAAPDFLLSIGSDRAVVAYDHYEITCRLLFERHPELLGIYVKTATEAQVNQYNSLSFPHRALRAIPPTAQSTPQLVARATILCMCNECKAALRLLSHSWETTLAFLDSFESLYRGRLDLFEELLIRCVESSDEDRLLELLAHRPHLAKQDIDRMVVKLCSRRKDLPGVMLRKVLIELTDQTKNATVDIGSISNLE